jgi:hypothetical protein
MRLLSVRLIVSLIVGVMLVSLCSSGYEVWVGKRNLRRDLQRRSEVLAESLAGSVERDLEKGAFPTLRKTVQRFANRENLIGMAVYDPQGNVIAITGDLASKMGQAPPVVLETLKENSEADAFQRLADQPVHICVLPLYSPNKFLGALAIVHDAGYIRAQSMRIWRETFERPGPGHPDCSDNPAHRALEYRRTNRADGALVASSTNWARTFPADGPPGRGVVPAAGAGSGDSCAKS